MTEEKLTETEAVEKELHFDLTTEDRARLMDESVKIEDEMMELKKELDAHKEELGEQIKSFETQLKQKRQLARQGYEGRTVRAELKKDFATATVAYWYDGREFERREMTPAERQKSMELAQPTFDMFDDNGERKVVVDNVLVGGFQDAPKAAPSHVEPEVAAIIREETNRKTKQDLSTT